MITNADLARTLSAAALLLLAAYAVGTTFERFRQPRVIGEIVGGLLLGPTVLGLVFPDAVTWLFPKTGPHASALGLLQQLGLLLMLFCAGGQMNVGRLPARERRTVGIVAVIGMVVPAAVAAALFTVIPLKQYWGPAADHTSILLVTCVAFAVTSIPVISRIMSDLGILRTQFARVVLGVAVVEDVVVYVALAIAVALAKPSPATAFGLSKWLGVTPGSGADITLKVSATLLLLLAIFTLGRPVLRLSSHLSRSVLRRGDPVTARIVVLIAATLLALVLGVETYLAAFAAGIAIARASDSPAAQANMDVIKRFSFAFFVPIYFALVGATLDLRHGFNVGLFLGFVIAACVVKGVSVYLGARLSGKTRESARSLAVALNARGGPGIVLSTVAYGAKIINLQYYAVLVLLAVLTSMFAGGYLARRLHTTIDDDEVAELSTPNQPQTASS